MSIRGGRAGALSAVCVVALMLCRSGTAVGQDNEAAPPSEESYSDSCPDPLARDWGPRQALAKSGITVCLNYIGELVGNPTGGIRRGAIYEGRVEGALTVDLEKLVDWSGATFHVNAYQIHGRGLSANDLGGNILTVSNIEAERTTRLFDLWLQQQVWGDLLSIRIGQLAADDEFVTSQYAGLFVNSSFGWPGIDAADLPSGGPAYPLSTPGLRAKVQATDQLSLMAAVFNGDPAGPGPGNPQSRDASGTDFRVNDGA